MKIYYILSIRKSNSATISMPIFNVIYGFFVELATILVTGFPYEDGVEMEIIEESGVTRLCPYTLNYPMQAQYAAGSSLPDNTISICGGEKREDNNEVSHDSDCRKLKDSKWENVGHLKTVRFDFGSSTIGNNKGTYIWLALIINTN